MTNPRSRNRSAAARRGNAMVELVVCLLPLMIVLLGTVLLGSLALARQEGAKAMAWYMADPDAQTSGDLSGRFFVGDRGVADIAAKRNNAPPDAVPTAEEPVLPYGNRIDGGTIDLVAAMERALNRIVTADGRVHTRDTKGVVRQLARLGIVTNYREVVGRNVDLDLDDPGNLDVPALKVDEDVLLMVADVLGDGRSGGAADGEAWLRYTRVQIDQYTGGLRLLGLGGGPLPHEPGGAEAERFRGDVVLRGENRQPLAMLEGVSHNPSATLGDHTAGRTPSIKLSKTPDKIEDESNEAVDPESTLHMRNPLWSGASESSWMKSRGLR